MTSNKVEKDALEGKEPYTIRTSTEIKDLSISVADDVTQEDAFRLVLSQNGTAASKIRFSNYRNDWNGLKYVVRDENTPKPSSIRENSGSPKMKPLEGLLLLT